MSTAIFLGTTSDPADTTTHSVLGTTSDPADNHQFSFRTFTLLVASQSPVQHWFSLKGKHHWDNPTARREESSPVGLDTPAWISFPKYMQSLTSGTHLLPEMSFHRSGLSDCSGEELGYQMSGGLGVPIAYCSVPRATSNYGKLEVYTIVSGHFCLQFNQRVGTEWVQVCD